MASKVLKYNDRYVIFTSDSCIFCTKAVNLLKKHNITYKSYNIDNIRGGFNYLLTNLIKHNKQINFNVHHETKPIIFKYGKYLGGFTELNALLSTY